MLRQHTIFDAEVEGTGETEVEGAVPAWLRGRLLRTAPVQELGDYRTAHWFDGLCLLYRIDFGERVTFAQRLLETRALAAAREGRMNLATFAGTIERSFLARLLHPIPEMTDNANVNVVPTADGWLAMTEAPVQQVVDGDSLRVRHPMRYRDGLGKLALMLAHPEWDAARREVVNIATRIGPRVELVPYRHPLGGDERSPIARIALRELPYLHAFGLTPSKVVIVAPPLLASPLSMLWSNKGYIEHFRWHDDRPTRVFLVDRASGRVTEHEADPFFFFHVANAYDDGDDVVLDLCAYRDPSLIDRLRMDRIHREFGADTWLERLRVSPRSKRVRSETVHREHVEFPTVDRRRALGRRHRFVFGGSIESLTSSVIKRIDLDSGRDRTFARERVVYGEPVFVPRPGSDREGDGVLLSVGSDLSRGRAEVVVLSAETLEPLATVRLPVAIPLGFHGSYQPLG